jgi:hypothetical protein
MDASGLLKVWRGFEAASGNEGVEFQRMLAMVEALYGENLSLTVMPCGAGDPTKAFLGVIGQDTESAALDRPSLLSRLGPETPDLTTILQVSRVPTERDRSTPPQTLIMQIMRRFQGSPDSIDRSAIDDFLFEMMRMTEDYGLQSAPKWPAIAITPLAIYRQIPASPALDDEEP